MQLATNDEIAAAFHEHNALKDRLFALRVQLRDAHSALREVGVILTSNQRIKPYREPELGLSSGERAITWPSVQEMAQLLLDIAAAEKRFEEVKKQLNL